MEAFRRDVTSLSSLDKNEEQAERQIKHVKYLLGVLQDEDRLEIHLSKRLKDILEDGKWLPNTVATYLNSFKSFVDYMKKTTSYEGRKLEHDRWAAIRIEINHMCNNVKKREDRRKISMEPKEIVSPEMMQGVMKSKRMSQAKALLANPPGETCKDRAVHTLVRNNVMLNILPRNAHRTGIILNMTVADHQKAELVEELYVIKIGDHKTALKFGQADVFVDQEGYELIGKYIRHFRPVSTHPNIFLNFSGNPMSAGHVGNAVSMELGQAGFERKITITDLRKMATTFVCSLLPKGEDWVDMANFMVSCFTL